MKDQLARVRERIKTVYDILEQDNYHTENKILQEALTILDTIAQAGDGVKAYRTEDAPQEDIDAVAASRCAIPTDERVRDADTHKDIFRELVKEMMQFSWNDHCADTGFFPDDFTMGKKELSFKAGRFVEYAADLIFNTPYMKSIYAAATAAHPKQDDIAERLAGALTDVKECNDIALSLKHEAKGIFAETVEPTVRKLCEHWGYGSIMSTVARLWYRKDPVGCFTIGQCYKTVENQQKDVIEALAAYEKQKETKE